LDTRLKIDGTRAIFDPLTFNIERLAFNL